MRNKSANTQDRKIASRCLALAIGMSLALPLLAYETVYLPNDKPASAGGNLEIVDVTSAGQATLCQRVQIGGPAESLALSPDLAKVYVARQDPVDKNQGRGALVVVDRATKTVDLEVPITFGTRPTWVEVRPNGNEAWVTNYGLGSSPKEPSISIIDLSSNAVANTIVPPVTSGNFDYSPIVLDFTPDGSRAYVTTRNGDVRVFDADPASATYMTELAQIPLPGNQTPWPACCQGDLAQGIVAGPTGKYVYVSRDVNHKPSIQPVLYVVDADPNSMTYNTIIRKIDIQTTGTNIFWTRRGAFSPDGNRLWVATNSGRMDQEAISIIDTDPNSATFHTEIDRAPGGATSNSTHSAAVSLDGNFGYTSLRQSTSTFRVFSTTSPYSSLSQITVLGNNDMNNAPSQDGTCGVPPGASTDSDGDGIDDDVDNCPDDANTDQADLDEDGLGDVCDDDADGDGEMPPADCNDLDPGIFTTAIEICSDGIDNDCDLLVDAADDGADCDGDTVPNGLDNCPDDANPGQADLDMDGLGDVCDPDDDNDGYEDSMDNCPRIANDQADFDMDGVGDACDDDADGDGVDDVNDLCLSTAPSDTDAGVPSKGLGKNRWADIDGNGLFNTSGKNPTGRYYTIEDTAGCNCAQIIETCGYGQGHTSFGCSISAMDWWTGSFDRDGEAPYQCKDD